MNKEKLEKQIQELKDKVAEIEAELQSKDRFEFLYKDYFLVGMDSIIEYKALGKEHDRFLEYGRYRKTRKEAEDALALQKRVMRLHALAEQLDGFGDKYFIYNTNDNWTYDSLSESAIYPETVFMTKECAKEICRMLNEGAVEL